MNTRIATLLFILLLASALAFLEGLAIQYFLYWRFFWYDIMMHFLGGFIISALYIWYVHFEAPETRKKMLLTFRNTLLFVFAVGVVWEIFEAVIHVDAEYTQAYWAFDTVKDLIMDCIGGSVAYWVTKQFAPKNG